MSIGTQASEEVIMYHNKMDAACAAVGVPRWGELDAERKRKRAVEVVEVAAEEAAPAVEKKAAKRRAAKRDRQQRTAAMEQRPAKRWSATLKK
eukprot:161048-Prymnesium_polylepis.1